MLIYIIIFKNKICRFFEGGYQAGFDHGKIHGRIEGRALGKEKGFEIWEELGYMEASAFFYINLNPQSKHKTLALTLIDMIGKFPKSNKSSQPTNVENENDMNIEKEEVDISNLIEKIRAKFKVFVTTTGVKRRLKTAPTPNLGF